MGAGLRRPPAACTAGPRGAEALAVFTGQSIAGSTRFHSETRTP